MIHLHVEIADFVRYFNTLAGEYIHLLNQQTDERRRQAIGLRNLPDDLLLLYLFITQLLFIVDVLVFDLVDARKLGHDVPVTLFLFFTSSVK